VQDRFGCWGSLASMGGGEPRRHVFLTNCLTPGATLQRQLREVQVLGELGQDPAEASYYVHRPG
jgi:hypothetical protein